MLFRCEVLERDLLILRKTFVTEPVVGEKEKKTHAHTPTDMRDAVSPLLVVSTQCHIWRLRVNLGLLTVQPVP